MIFALSSGDYSGSAMVALSCRALLRRLFGWRHSHTLRTPLNLIEPTALLINSLELIGFGLRCT